MKALERARARLAVRCESSVATKYSLLMTRQVQLVLVVLSVVESKAELVAVRALERLVLATVLLLAREARKAAPPVCENSPFLPEFLLTISSRWR